MDRRLLMRAAVALPLASLAVSAQAKRGARVRNSDLTGIVLGIMAVIGGVFGVAWWRGKAARATAERELQVAEARLRAAQRRAGTSSAAR